MNEPDPTWFSEYEKRQQQAHDEAQAAVAGLLDRLTQQRIATVRLAYDGYGDSGAIEEVTAQGEDGTTIDLPEDLKSALIDAGATLLPSGWEINEGAFGDLVLDVGQRRLTRQHNWRVESSEYEEEDWSL